LHIKELLAVYPSPQAGWQEAAWLKVELQVPIEPWPGATTWQGIGTQKVAERLPALHDDGPLAVYPSMHDGWHEEPCVNTAGQLPSCPSIGGLTTQEFGMHVLELKLPYKQVENPLMEYPSLHLIWHRPPCETAAQLPSPPFKGEEERVQACGTHSAWGVNDPRLQSNLSIGSKPVLQAMSQPDPWGTNAQFPMFPFRIGPKRLQFFGRHSDRLKAPSVQLEVPLATKPSLHWIWQVPPLDTKPQVPILPNGGFMVMRQGLDSHLVEVSCPKLHDVKPVATYPPLQLGKHTEPLARDPVQLPIEPFPGGAEASQELGKQLAGDNFPARQLVWPLTM
jgi:hypothetical protein